MSNGFQLTDELLGAYADGELDRETAARVERALGEDGSARSRLEALRQVSMLVRATARVEIPGSRDAAAGATVASLTRRAGGGWAPFVRAGLGRLAGAFAVGVAVAVGVGALLRVPDTSAWSQRILALHESYLQAASTGQRFPLDMRGGTVEEIAAQFAPMLGAEPQVPDLSAAGYAPHGARLVISPEGEALHVFYEAAGRPLLGLTLGPYGAAGPPGRSIGQRGTLTLLERSNGRSRFSVVGEHDAAELESLADAVAARGVDGYSL